jgi:hypothetical protein
MNPQNWIEMLLRLWERSVPMLAALAAICIATVAVLGLCWFFGVGPAAAFTDYGVWLMVSAIAFAILAVFKKIEGRPGKALHLIADEQQSFWAQSRQSDGRITTQFAFRFQATNLTDQAITFVTCRLVRPWLPRGVYLSRNVIVRHPQRDIFGSEYPILPRGTSPASCGFIVNRPIGKPGRIIVAVVSVSDQFGRWHKLKFKELRYVGKP